MPAIYSKNDFMDLDEVIMEILNRKVLQVHQKSFLNGIISFIRNCSHEQDNMINEIHSLPFVLYTSNIGLFGSPLSDKVGVADRNYQNVELPGEGTYYALLYDHGILKFRVSRNNMNNFLFKAEIEEIPLLITVPVIDTFVNWRIRIGK